MFEDRHMDDQLKSILDSGREDVPAHVWDGISKGLDQAERRKTVVLWFRRAGAAAIAAALVLGAILHSGQKEYEVPAVADSEMVAVAEPDIHKQETDITYKSQNLVAYARPSVRPPVKTEPDVQAASVQVCVETEKPSESEPETHIHTEQDIYKQETVSEEWEEDEKALKIRTSKASLTVSGIAGTNNPQNRSGSMPLKSPSAGKQYTRTTIEQTGSETIYGIPLSFGVGTRIRVSDRWSVGAGINYTLLTSRFNGKYIKVTDGIADDPISGNVRNRQHYLGIPINVYYDIVQKDFINFYAYAGGAVEKCIMNKYQMQAGTVINHSEGVKNVQLSANAGIGVEFMLGKHVGIYIDPSLRYYFNNGQPKSIRTAQPLMFGFETGLRFNL